MKTGAETINKYISLTLVRNGKSFDISSQLSSTKKKRLRKKEMERKYKIYSYKISFFLVSVYEIHSNINRRRAIVEVLFSK